MKYNYFLDLLNKVVQIIDFVFVLLLTAVSLASVFILFAKISKDDELNEVVFKIIRENEKVIKIIIVATIILGVISFLIPSRIPMYV